MNTYHFGTKTSYGNFLYYIVKQHTLHNTSYALCEFAISNYNEIPTVFITSNIAQVVSCYLVIK